MLMNDEERGGSRDKYSERMKCNSRVAKFSVKEPQLIVLMDLAPLLEKEDGRFSSATSHANFMSSFWANMVFPPCIRISS
mmetsp:Transcript_46281/g.98172  ORF Transcript_46281/g.98172 Transcript_46281/m.98172 type:complete len:80 (-) Transcript_46281:359-598(-)